MKRPEIGNTYRRYRAQGSETECIRFQPIRVTSFASLMKIRSKSLDANGRSRQKGLPCRRDQVEFGRRSKWAAQAAPCWRGRGLVFFSCSTSSESYKFTADFDPSRRENVGPMSSEPQVGSFEGDLHEMVLSWLNRKDPIPESWKTDTSPVYVLLSVYRY